MNIYSSTRIKCPDFFKRHKKCVYKSAKISFLELNDLAQKVELKFPLISVKNSDTVCSNCYKFIQKSTSADKDIEIDNECWEEINSVENENCDDEFRPTTPTLIQKANDEIYTLTEGNISPLKLRSQLQQAHVESYVFKKRKEIVNSFDDKTNDKLRKLYHLPNFDSKISLEPSCNEWINNFGIALKNCSVISEKIKLLTLLPDSYHKKQILEFFPEVTSYMFDKAKQLVKTKGIYSSPDIYSGHPIDEKIKEKVVSYYLNDDLDCSRQSPNMRDVITVKENNIKEKKAKRFLTRSVKEMYEIFKKDNPEMKISISSFYSLRPKHVSIGAINQVCLCIYCANFDLYLSALQNFLKVNCSEMKDIRANILGALVCESVSESCFLQECKLCPGIKGVTPEVLRLPTEYTEEEISFAVWNNGDLIKKTTSVSSFILEFAGWAFKVSVHIYVKNIQRQAIKMEKEKAITNFRHLIIQVDFAENWNVVIKNAVQGNHWLNKSISIFTAVCHQGNEKKSFAVISDDGKHDSAHALLATKIIIESMIKFSNSDPSDVTLISDGAASHFKNRFQLYEMKDYKFNVKRLFSGTGHGKGPVDAIGGLVKHYATNHNLIKPHSEAIQTADEFARIVPNYTTAISLIYLPKEQVESLREKKIVEWKRVKEQPGIQKTHVWKSLQENGQVKLFTARTAETPMILVKEIEKRVKTKQKIN